MTCPNCGAPLTVALDWCNRCFTRVGDPGGGELTVGEGQAVEPVEVAPAEYSRWHGGPTTFGPAARLVMTGLVVGFSLSIAVMLRQAIVTPHAVLAIAGVVSGAIVALAFIWKRGQVG